MVNNVCFSCRHFPHSCFLPAVNPDSLVNGRPQQAQYGALIKCILLKQLLHKPLRSPKIFPHFIQRGGNIKFITAFHHGIL